MLFGDGWLDRQGKGGKTSPFTWEVSVLQCGIILLHMGCIIKLLHADLAVMVADQESACHDQESA